MRSMGFLLAVIGGLVAYLGYRGNMGHAWTAIRTGTVPTSPTPAPSGNMSPTNIVDNWQVQTPTLPTVDNWQVGGK